jgi:hypothetical protein
MSTRNLHGGKARPVRKANNLTTIYDCAENVGGGSTSHTPMGPHSFSLVMKFRGLCHVKFRGDAVTVCFGRRSQLQRMISCREFPDNDVTPLVFAVDGGACLGCSYYPNWYSVHNREVPFGEPFTHTSTVTRLKHSGHYTYHLV